MVKKRVVISISIITTGIFVAIFIFFLRFNYSYFRYGFDIIFNQESEHKSYVENADGNFEKIILPLPPSTTKAYKHSDSAVVYYTKLTYNEFIKYYIDNGYKVKDNIITFTGSSFQVMEVSKDDKSRNKYYFVDIDLFKSD